MVVRGMDNSIWTATFNSSGVFNNDWTKLTGATPSEPALAWNGTTQKMLMVVRGMDNSIWTATFNSSGVFNNDWTKLTGSTSSGPALAWNETAQIMQMVVRGMDNSIWTATFNSSGVFNNDWTKLTGATPSGPALAWIPAPTNKMLMVVRGMNNSIWTASINPPPYPGLALGPSLPLCASGVTVGLPGFVTALPAGSVTNPPTGCWPDSWPIDGRDGGVPDPTTVGPSIIQIGSEGGILPAPVVIDNVPIGYEYNRRDITVLNVTNKSVFLGPAERADAIIDFSQFAGKTLILYNDAAAPVPAFDPRNDFYTNNPDQSATGNNTGGAPTTLAGFGPNTRTIMQIVVSGTANGTPFNLAGLQTALPTAYVASQPPPVVPETTYPPTYNATTDTYARIQDNFLTFTPVVATPLSVASVTVNTQGSGCTSGPTVTFTGGGGTGAAASAFLANGGVNIIQINNGGTGYTSAPAVGFTGGGCLTPPTATANLGFPLLAKAIQELFELNYGRMNATLGVELPFTNFNTQTTIPWVT